VAEPQANGSISVLQSFGEFKLENWLRAQQFANSYNQLRDLAKTRQPENSDEFFRAALAIFGVVLGAAIIAALLGED